MRRPSGTKSRNVKNNVFDILQAQARAGDEIAIELLEQRRTAEKTPAKLVEAAAVSSAQGRLAAHAAAARLLLRPLVLPVLA